MGTKLSDMNNAGITAHVEQFAPEEQFDEEEQEEVVDDCDEPDPEDDPGIFDYHD